MNYAKRSHHLMRLCFFQPIVSLCALEKNIFIYSKCNGIIGRSVRSTTIASVLQIPTTPPPTTTTTTPPIIPKKNHETSTSTVGTVQVADRPC